MIVVAISTVHCMICSTEEKLKRNRTILPTPLGTTITPSHYHTLPLSHPPTITPSHYLTLPLSHPHPPTIAPLPSHYHTLSSTAPQLPISSVHSLTVSHGVLSYWMPVTSLTTPSTPPSLSSTQPLVYNTSISPPTLVHLCMLLGYHQRTMVSVCVCVCDGIGILLL